MTEQTEELHRIEILLVEDNPGDVRLTQEALKEGKVYNNLNVVSDGVEAMAYLRREGKYVDSVIPDIILLDLNLPKMDGREVLAAIKDDKKIKRIPVVVLTTSKDDAEQHIIDEHDGLAVDVERQLGLPHAGCRTQCREIIAVECDVERADLEFGVLDLAHRLGNAPGHRHPAPLDTNNDQI